jgi:hypothetical protein
MQLPSMAAISSSMAAINGNHVDLVAADAAAGHAA